MAKIPKKTNTDQVEDSESKSVIVWVYEKRDRQFLEKESSGFSKSISAGNTSSKDFNGQFSSGLK